MRKISSDLARTRRVMASDVDEIPGATAEDGTSDCAATLGCADLLRFGAVHRRGRKVVLGALLPKLQDLPRASSTFHRERANISESASDSGCASSRRSGQHCSASSRS